MFTDNIGLPGQIREFVIQINLSCVQIRRFYCSQVYLGLIFPFLAFKSMEFLLESMYVSFKLMNNVLLSLFGHSIWRNTIF